MMIHFSWRVRSNRSAGPSPSNGPKVWESLYLEHNLCSNNYTVHYIQYIVIYSGICAIQKKDLRTYVNFLRTVPMARSQL